MKLSKLMVALGFGVVMATGIANAADEGSGTIKVIGSIVDAPCSITPETANQTVDLGQVSQYELADGKTSNVKAFQIKLENCDMSADGGTAKTKVQVTFSGINAEGSTDLIAITGAAKGAGVALIDESGSKVQLGSPVEIKIADGTNTLNFATYLQGISASGGVTPGDFESAVNFKMAYE